MTDLAAASRRARFGRMMPRAEMPRPPVVEPVCEPVKPPAPVKLTSPPPIMGALIARFGPWWGAHATTEIPIPTIRRIQQVISYHYDVSLAELRSSRRTAQITWARQLAMYLARTMTVRSLAEIGHQFGGKDHTTVRTAAIKFEQLVLEDEELAAEVAEIKGLINGTGN